MPVGTKALEGNYTSGTPNFPASFSSVWVDAVTDVTAADASAIDDPAAEITASTRNIITRERWMGTNLCVRLLYEQGAGTPVGPTLAVFGRYDSNQPWERPLTRGNARTVTFTPATATDTLFSSALRSTEVNSSDHIVDMLGNNEFLVGVEVVGSGGVSTAAKVQVKFI